MADLAQRQPRGLVDEAAGVARSSAAIFYRCRFGLGRADGVMKAFGDALTAVA